MEHKNQEEVPMFEEILHEPKIEEKPDFVAAIVSPINDPKHCQPLLKVLDNLLPLRRCNATNEDLIVKERGGIGHLRRIRRVRALSSEQPRSKSETETSPEKFKKTRPTVRLEVVMQTPEIINQLEEEGKKVLDALVTKYDLKLEERQLPGRPATCKHELTTIYNPVWPTLFFPKNTDEVVLALSDDEVNAMIEGMKRAISDSHSSRRQLELWHTKEHEHEMLSTGSILPKNSEMCGAVIQNPVSGEIISRASNERKRLMASEIGIFPDLENPLCTPTLLAIQGVSRREREAAIDLGMNSTEFKSGQYLCTGYDVYLTKEPDVFEAMSLVHSRARRVVFGVADGIHGGLGGSVGENAVHSLPGTNHHYRAFYCSNNNCEQSLYRLCWELHRSEESVSGE